MNKFQLFLSLSLLATLSACGGSSGSNNELLIEGTMIEAGGAGHKVAYLKHASGQAIESVTICALGECSTTDAEGQWGFVVDNSALGTEVLFSINGHGIDAETIVSLPTAADEIFIHFNHVEGGTVAVHHLLTDGGEIESHEEESSSDAH